MTTTKEIIEMQKRHKWLTERSKTIVADLRELEGVGVDKKLRADAAEVIEWLHSQIVGLQKDLEEAQRSARDAYYEGRQDESDDSRWR